MTESERLPASGFCHFDQQHKSVRNGKWEKEYEKIRGFFLHKKNKGRHCKEAGLELDVCMAGCTCVSQDENNISTSLEDFFDMAIGHCGG